MIKWLLTWIAIFDASLLLAQTPAKDPPIILRAKSLIATQLIDPESVQFRSIRIIDQTVQGRSLTIACGEYNSRNRMGGYAGFAEFAYEPTVLKGIMSFDGRHYNEMPENGAQWYSDEASVNFRAAVLDACSAGLGKPCTDCRMPSCRRRYETVEVIGPQLKRLLLLRKVFPSIVDATDAHLLVVQNALDDLCGD